VLGLYLESLACRSSAAETAEEALEALLAAAASGAGVELCLVDEGPGLGDALERAIRTERGLEKVMVVRISHASARDESQPGVQLTPTLLRPIKLRQLEACLAQVLERSARIEGLALPARVAASPAPDRPAVTKGAKVLLVEDNRVNQKLALSLLTRAGYTVEVADSGVAAVSALRRRRFDAVLMDLQMPQMDGMEATRIIRDPTSRMLQPDVPIIALTAHALQGDRERCLEVGMDDYVTKPLQPEQLFAALERAIVAGRRPQVARAS
jgi:CheY-like chemotaxis protein